METAYSKDRMWTKFQLDFKLFPRSFDCRNSFLCSTILTFIKFTAFFFPSTIVFRNLINLLEMEFYAS